MLIARQKRKENLAEYILYMFQVEDIIRAFNFDQEKINLFVLSQYKSDEKTTKEINEWYWNLAQMMKKEKITDKGHLVFITNLINELEEFHLKILQKDFDNEYTLLFKSSEGLINEFKQKSENLSGDVHACLYGVYMYLILKIQKKEVSKETTNAMKKFSSMLSYLSRIYRDFEQGNLEL